MKHTPEDRRVLERMAPGALSKDGFLGTDARPLADIIAADRRRLAELGVSKEAVADRLAEVLEKAQQGLGCTVQVGDHLEAVYRESMGRIPSPWPGEGVFQKGEVELVDTRDDARVRFTPLSVHLIRAHIFFQGRGAVYRLEPEKLARMLDLMETQEESDGS
jgi:hypothetical protein